MKTRAEAIATLAGAIRWGAAEYDGTCGTLYQAELAEGRAALLALGVTEAELDESYDS